MSHDSLASLGANPGLLQEAQYEAVYAAVSATERGRWFLAEFASRNRHAATDRLTAALARIEAAVGVNGVGQAAAGEATAGDANGKHWPRRADIAAAAQRISDIAFGLRERTADPALCDALEAAVRDLIAACGKPAVALDALSGEAELGASVAGTETLPATKNAAPYATSGTVAASQAQSSSPRWFIEPPDLVYRAPDRETNSQTMTASESAQTPHALLPVSSLLPGPQDKPEELLDSVPMPGGVELLRRRDAAAPVRSADIALPQSPPASEPAVRVIPRPAAVNPLDVLRALSEDELIALFG